MLKIKCIHQYTGKCNSGKSFRSSKQKIIIFQTSHDINNRKQRCLSVYTLMNTKHIKAPDIFISEGNTCSSGNILFI